MDANISAYHTIVMRGRSLRLAVLVLSDRILPLVEVLILGEHIVLEERFDWFSPANLLLRTDTSVIAGIETWFFRVDIFRGLPSALSNGRLSVRNIAEVDVLVIILSIVSTVRIGYGFSNTDREKPPVSLVPEVDVVFFKRDRWRWGRTRTPICALSSWSLGVPLGRLLWFLNVLIVCVNVDRYIAFSLDINVQHTGRGQQPVGRQGNDVSSMELHGA